MEAQARPIGGGPALRARGEQQPGQPPSRAPSHLEMDGALAEADSKASPVRGRRRGVRILQRYILAIVLTLASAWFVLCWSFDLLVRPIARFFGGEYYGLSPRSVLLNQEAFAELGKRTLVTTNAEYALYPRRYYQQVDSMLATLPKKYDFCFIGSLYVDQATLANRKWVLDFTDAHFTRDSFLQLSDFGPSRRSRPSSLAASAGAAAQ